MPQVINTNIASLNAQRQLNKSQKLMEQTMARLSSGLRINSAKDDAAGLAIADRFTAQIKGLNMASRNANDGISMSQVAEGAMGEMTTNLQRLREISIQSANGTNSATDRAALNDEAQQLVAEIGRISDQTEFNGIKLLNGTAGTQTLQIGANAGQTFSMVINKMTTDALGGGQSATTSAIGSNKAIAKGDLVINGVTISGSTASDDTFSVNNVAASSIAKVAAINRHTAETGVIASANATVASGAEQTLPATSSSGTITINGVTTENIALGTGDTATNRKAVIEAIMSISGQTGVKALDTGKPETGINLIADDGRNITVSFTTNSGTFDETTTGISAAGTYEGGYNLRSVNNSSITIKQSTGDINNAGLAEGTYTPNTGTVSSVIRYSDSAVTGSVDVATGHDFSGGGAQEQFDISVSGAPSVRVVLNGNYADQTSLAQGLQDAINTALAPYGSNIVSVQAMQNESTNGQYNLMLQSKERISISNVQNTDGTTAAQAFLTELENSTYLDTANDIKNAGDLSTAGNGYTFDVTDENGNTIASGLTLKGNYTADATGSSLAADLQTQLDTALGTGIVTVNSIENTTTAGNYDLQISSLQQFKFANVTAGGTTVTALDALNGKRISGVGVGGPDSLRDGDVVINNISIRAAKVTDDTYSNNVAASSNKASSGISIAAAINAASASTGVTASVRATEVGGRGTSTTGVAGAVGAVYINGQMFEMTLTGNSELDRSSAKTLINKISGETGVVAEDTGNALKLKASDGRNISVVIDSNDYYNKATNANGGLALTDGFNASDIGLDATQKGIAQVDLTGKLNGDRVGGGGVAAALDITSAAYKTVANVYAETTTSQVTLNSAGEFTISAGKNNSAELEEMGFQVGTFGGIEAAGQFLNTIDISTTEGATKALEAVDNALTTINSERGRMGAVQNRLSSTISAISISSENLSASRSRIQDTDFAAETAELSRVQILQQAGTAMLSQANASTQNVLTLLR